MDKIFDYIRWRSDLTVNVEKINEVDMAIFSQLIMIPYKKFIDMPLYQTDASITIEELGKYMKPHKKEVINTIGLVVPSQIVSLLDIIRKTKRYKDIKLTNYVSDISTQREIQFTAFTLEIDDHTIVVFSGTDDTIIGWKENINMIYDYPTPAQIESVKYLEYIAKNKKHVEVIGHSKGGNLAMYSYTFANNETQNKVTKVYSFDGQGFSDELNEEQILKCNKITTYCGDTGIVGYLFNHYEKHCLVACDSQGLYQHDLFSWSINVDHFEKATKRSEDSIYIENKVKTMLENMDYSMREKFSNAIYNILVCTNSNTLLELNANKFKLIKSYFGSNKEERKVLDKTLRELFLDKVVFKNIFQMFKDFTVKEKEKNKMIREIDRK